VDAPIGNAGFYIFLSLWGHSTSLFFPPIASCRASEASGCLAKVYFA